MEFKNGEDSAVVRSKRSRHLLRTVFLIILAGISLLLHIEKFRRHKEVLTAKEQFSAIGRDQVVEKIKAQRGRFYMTRYYLGYPAATSYVIADFIRRLSTVIPPQHVRDLQMGPGLQNFSFQLTVGIAAGGTENAQVAAARYLAELRKFPEIMQISLAKADPDAGVDVGALEYSFSISGQAEIR